MDFLPANQRVPSHFLNRKFGIGFNVPKMAPLAEANRSFPSVGADTALALAAVALNRVIVALAGQAQADDGQVAGSVAAWADEVEAAKADALDAEAAVAAAFPSYETSTAVSGLLAAKQRDDLGLTAYAAPSQLAIDWTTSNAAPVGAVNVVVVLPANNDPISINLVELSTAADADSDLVRVDTLNGVDIDYTDGNDAAYFDVDGKSFTFVKETQLLTADAQIDPATWSGTFVLADDEGGLTDEFTWSIENPAA